MPGLYLPSAVGDRAAFALTQCFNEGVEEGINRTWKFRVAPDTGGVTLPHVMETVRVVASSTAEETYTYPSTNYDEPETQGDEIPEFASSLYEQTIPNQRDKRRGLKVDRTAWTDDKIDRFRVKFHEAGVASVVAPYTLLVNFMRNARVNGNPSNPMLVSQIDNLPFFGPRYAIPGDPTSQGWTNSQPLGALTAPIFETAWATMLAYPREGSTAANPKPRGRCPTHLAVGPADLSAALSISYASRPPDGSGGGNVQGERVEVCLVPEWQNGEWMLLDASSMLRRGFIFQERAPNQLAPLFTGVDEPMVLFQGFLSWLLHGRYVVGLGDPSCVFRGGRSGP